MTLPAYDSSAVRTLPDRMVQHFLLRASFNDNEFALELEDPIRKRTIRHQYKVNSITCSAYPIIRLDEFPGD
jgi:hypothetical protein